MIELRTLALASLAALAACGGGSTTSTKEPQVDDTDFVGNWTLSTGTLAESCPDATATMSTLNQGADNLQISANGPTELAVAFNAPDDDTESCSAAFDLSGEDAASLHSASNCTPADGQTYTFSTASTLNLSQAGIAADLSYSTTPEFGGTSCNKHLQAVFTKF